MRFIGQIQMLLQKRSLSNEKKGEYKHREL